MDGEIDEEMNRWRKGCRNEWIKGWMNGYNKTSSRWSVWGILWTSLSTFYMFDYFHNKMLGERFLKERKGWTWERQRHSKSEQRKIYLKARVYHQVLLSTSNYIGKKMDKRIIRTFLVLVVRWIGILLPKQGTRVWSRDLKILHAAEQLRSHNYWALQQENPLQREARAGQPRIAPAPRN